MLLAPLYSFSQNADDLKVYQHIEPRMFIGASQWYAPNTSRFDIINPSYEFGITYSFSLPNNFVLYPYIGYSIVTINNTEPGNNPSFIALERFQSLIGGASLYYKLNKWSFGVGFYGKNIFEVYQGLGDKYHQFGWDRMDNIIMFSRDYYLGGLSVLYSFPHFNIIAEARFNPSGIYETLGPGIPYGSATIHINEYLIGVGYHL